MKLQNRVRELRAKHRLSQGDLGKVIGSSQQTISKVKLLDGNNFLMVIMTSFVLVLHVVTYMYEIDRKMIY
ncbi:helix-turn-helix domain-containing protein [Bacillus sp. AFS054943]|uniref:Helix-turn-helix domain-containing protein n=1 Tax=Bacillus cereus TaxID=1396 RepID=A0A2A8INU7_BACCE|nr:MULTISPECIES: helix-turn-helix domain-containing protein [Bacillus]MDH4423158.1 helix-turn-helix domain-containing protein [Bacillus cereus]PER20038.1 helix-turn-helix domain-containing protein [Bacillus cereus]PFA59017.1 helix-turn-helix domain-containing protein [Bacillus sp. AFS015896]PGL75203.1 helix-turn-helix domain-containing protein [Bacillus sp. AFS054943]PGT96119.1 helix-turn-helix domain-containing protein [Bacillus cereus]